MRNNKFWQNWQLNSKGKYPQFESESVWMGVALFCEVSIWESVFFWTIEILFKLFTKLFKEFDQPSECFASVACVPVRLDGWKKENSNQDILQQSFTRNLHPIPQLPRANGPKSFGRICPWALPAFEPELVGLWSSWSRRWPYRLEAWWEEAFPGRDGQLLDRKEKGCFVQNSIHF